MKFHIIAMSVIIGVILLIFLFMGRLQSPAPVQQQPDIVTNDRVIFISRASWGLNCNKTYEHYVRQKKRFKQPIPPGIERIEPNNVLKPVSQHCNGKKTCSFTPSDEAFGIEKASACRKSFEAEYRCFSYDRIWKVTGQSRQEVTIDCRKE